MSNLTGRPGRSLRLHSLSQLITYCFIPIVLFMALALVYSNLTMKQMKVEVADSQRLAGEQAERMRYVQTVQQPVLRRLRELELLVSRFSSEFELLVLDPERSDDAIIELRLELVTFMQTTPRAVAESNPQLSEWLQDSAGLVLDLLDELLETGGSNDRYRLYRNSTDPLVELFEGVAQAELDQEVRSRAAQLALNQAAERSRQGWEQLVSSFVQVELITQSLMLLIVLTNLVCWWLLGRLLRQRLNSLASFASAIAQGKQQKIPFISADSTGRLAVSLARTARRIRRLLRETRLQTELAESARNEAEKLAFYDPLTELANRRSFNYHLDQVLRSVQRERQLYALFYLDLDNFKYINDSLGHDVGDELLICVTSRLKHCLREGDFVARLGGDEFAVLGRGGTREVTELAQRVLQRLSQPVELNGSSLAISCSIGIAFVRIDGDDASTLQKNADLALYKAKEQGRNNFQFFSPELHALSMHRMRMVMELRQAYENDEFFLQYQPKYNLATGELCSMEALIRWSHDKEGVVSPDDFIPLAEETGLITEIGAWVMRQACADICTLASRGIQLPVAVNLSGRQFYDGDLAQTVQGILNEYGVKPCWLELEVTETMLIDDIDASVKVLQQLREQGVSIAIDDFGMGFSSLNYLKKLPVDVLKIDRSFVRQVPRGRKDCAVINTIVELAHRLDMTVVAEGIETAEQQDYLQSIGCDVGQGYYLGRPAQLSDLLLAEHYSVPERSAPEPD